MEIVKFLPQSETLILLHYEHVYKVLTCLSRYMYDDTCLTSTIVDDKELRIIDEIIFDNVKEFTINDPLREG
jgi:hypothetical protein